MLYRERVFLINNKPCEKMVLNSFELYKQKRELCLPRGLAVRLAVELYHSSLCGHRIVIGVLQSRTHSVDLPIHDSILDES